jgi:4,5-dihydroxyphthalate decarboxylase
MDTYPHTARLKDGGLASSRFAFRFHDEYRPVHTAFKRMVRDDAFDLSEMAAATALQAVVAGKPLVVLPAVMLSRFHHGSLVRAEGSDLKGAADLGGRRVAVRSYGQTTGLWARGVLAREYGVDLDTVTWVVFEEGHVAEAATPPNVVKAPEGASVESMLTAGQVDAAIVGRQRSVDSRITPLIPDHANRAMAWFEKTRIMPVNHMLVLSRRVADAWPWLIDELWRLLAQGRQSYLRELPALEPANPDQAMAQELLRLGHDPLPFGLDSLGPIMEFAASLSFEQRLIDRALSLEEVFAPCVRHLR